MTHLLFADHQVRIEDASFTCVIYGDNLGDLGRKAYDECQRFYGEQLFRIERLSATGVITMDGNILHYSADVYAVAT